MAADETVGHTLDLSTPRRVHIVGVAGAGMSAIALLLARMGHRVSGSDIKESPVFGRLAGAGVTVAVGNCPEHVPVDAHAVVYSTAVPRSNPELAAARAHGIPAFHRAAALAAIVATKRTIAVAGSHGKTTTSSMLALVLRDAGWDPSFVIGGEVNEVGTNAAYGTGEWLVVEADESDGTFLQLAPEVALVTNVEPDHLDHYGGFDGLISAFDRFLDAVPGLVVCGGDDRISARLAATRDRVRTYGERPSADYQVRDYRGAASGCHFTLARDNEVLGTLTVPLGVKAATNAAGAAALALELGVSFETIERALRGFGGVARRFQFRGQRDGVTFVDDYAHLPGEVVAAIAAAREGDWQRVIAVFQPHRYSRTANLWQDFADAFAGADAVVITDVYAAGEEPIGGVSGRLIAHAVADAHAETPVEYAAGAAELASVPERLARPGDVVLTMGAGDLTTLPDVWLASDRALLGEQEPT
ncbi:MAG: UDP-N-acetylmuramate--L-alanine ligase [Actinomycetota bacterium]